MMHYDLDRNPGRWNNPLWDAYWLVQGNVLFELGCYSFLLISTGIENSHRRINIEKLKTVHGDIVKKLNAQL